MSTGNWKLFTTMIKNIGSKKLNRDMIGFTLEEETGPVSRDDILSFARATKDENPVYNKEDAMAPPLFIAKLIIPMLKQIWCHEDLRFNLLRMVHAQQEISWHSPIRAGEQLKMKVSITDIYDTPVGEMMEVSGQCYKGDKLAVEGVSGFIIRGKKKKPGKKPDKEEPLKEKFRIKIITDEGQQMKYAEASGDHNFIHTNNFLAKMAGLPRTIMHGACIMAMSCHSLAEKNADSDIMRLRSIKGRFAKTAIPGQELTLVGYDSPDPGGIPFEVLDPAGKTVFKNGIFKFE